MQYQIIPVKKKNTKEEFEINDVRVLEQLRVGTEIIGKIHKNDKNSRKIILDMQLNDIQCHIFMPMQTTSHLVPYSLPEQQLSIASPPSSSLNRNDNYPLALMPPLRQISNSNNNQNKHYSFSQSSNSTHNNNNNYNQNKTIPEHFVNDNDNNEQNLALNNNNIKPINNNNIKTRKSNRQKKSKNKIHSIPLNSNNQQQQPITSISPLPLVKYERCQVHANKSENKSDNDDDEGKMASDTYNDEKKSESDTDDDDEKSFVEIYIYIFFATI